MRPIDISIRPSRQFAVRGQDGASLQRSDEPDDLVPMLADNIDLHTGAQQRLERRVLSGRLDAGHAAIGEIAQARTESKIQHSAQGEDVIGRTAGVGVMRIDLKPGIVMKQTVEDVGRFGFRIRDTQTDKRMLERWTEILAWWTKVPGVDHPAANDLRARQRFVSDNLEFRLGTAVGRGVAQR